MAQTTRAPLSRRELAQLTNACRDLKAAALARGVTLDANEEAEEAAAAHAHFELGCWLYFFRHRVGKPEGLQDRIACVLKLFEAGIASPEYMFFTAFEFGPRQFDSCFEAGDGDQVREAMLSFAAGDPSGNVARCVREMGWMNATAAA